MSNKPIKRATQDFSRKCSDLSVIILAGGQGNRFGSQKQFLEVDGQQLWQISKELSEKYSDEVIVAGIDTPAGSTRLDTVRLALGLVTRPRVLILEAARFLVREKHLDLLVQSTAQSACFYRKTTNTAIVLEDSKMDLLRRDNMYEIHTPQIFDTNILKLAHSVFDPHPDITDDCSLIYHMYGTAPQLIEGDWCTALKLTYPQDLSLMLKLYYQN